MTDNEIIKTCGEVCGDNRFELIEKYKKRLIEATNIETSKDEMAVINSILFRCWQMGWLDKLEDYKRQQAEIDQFADIGKMYSEIRAEAIEEFAGKLKKRLERKYTSYGREYVLRHLRELVKEMTESKK